MQQQETSPLRSPNPKKSLEMRVVSLLPSATEVFGRLASRSMRLHAEDPSGAVARGVPVLKLVGRSHECDYPPRVVKDVPILTSANTTFTTSKDVDRQVREALAGGNSLYTLDVEKLHALKPDVILTQSLCNVCSVDLRYVNHVVQNMPTPQPKVVDLNPRTLNDVLQDLILVGKATECENLAKEDLAELQSRIDIAKAEGAKRQRVVSVCQLEWTEPLFIGGHWTPEIIELAGGRQGLNPKIGVNSFVVTPEQLVDDDPEMIIVCPCGLDLKTTREQVEALEKSEWWAKLQAPKVDNAVILVDGNQFFNRPGPRLVDCLEWMVWLFAQLESGGIDGHGKLSARDYSADFSWDVHQNLRV